MSKFYLIGLFLVISLSFLQAQEVIKIYTGKAPGAETWNWKEKEMFSSIFQTQIVYNVSEPSLQVFRPAAGTANGTAVVIAPGGGFHILSINSEGNDVAKWLNAKGITAFVLKYRVAHSLTDDPVKELMGKMGNPTAMESTTREMIPMSIQDGIAAVKYVKSHAAEYNIDPKKIGIIGFSAGGTVTVGAGTAYSADSRPDFIAPIYAFVDTTLIQSLPKDVPPAFVLAASDDQLGLASHSVKIYNSWIAARKPVELHMYAKGGHGFGMKKQGLPADQWIDLFYNWLKQQGFVKTTERSK